MFEKGSQLRNRWRDIVSEKGGDGAVMDVCMWVSRATFDVVGIGGPSMIPVQALFI